MKTATKNGTARSPRDQVHDLAIDCIRMDDEIQPRKGENIEILREYTLAYLDGAEFPPVDVFWDRAEDAYWLADGFHRVRAAAKASLPSIRAHVHLGTRRDAILFSVGANSEHGLRRTNEDKQAAVLKLLDDPEWCLWSDPEIARACHVSATMVRQYRISSPNLRGHKVESRINANGTIGPLPRREPATARPVSHAMREAPLTKGEISELYASKMAKHLRKHDPETRTKVPYDFGSVEIVTSRRLYHTLMARDTDYIYRTVGRLMVARACIDPTLGITLVGHFAPTLDRLIATLERLNIECVTPEQVLRRDEV